MELLEYEMSFVESIGHLLKRFCPEALLGSLDENLQQLRAHESAIIASAKNATASDLQGTHNLVETGYLENIITECGSALPSVDFLALLNEMGSLCITYGEQRAAKSAFTKVITIGGSAKAHAAAVGFAHCKRAELRIRQAHWAGAATDLKKAAASFRKVNDVEGLAMVENNLGVQASERDSLKKATLHFKKAHEGFERSGNFERSNLALMNLGILATIIGRWDEAMACYNRVLPRFEELGQSSRKAEVHYNIGMLLLSKGEPRESMRHFDECLIQATRTNYETFAGFGYLGKAAVHARMEDYPLAMVFARKALAIFRRQNDRLSIADAYRIKGIIHRELDQPQLAELYFRTSLRLNEECGSPLNQGETYVELGRLYARTQQRSQAVKAIRKAVATFKKIGAKHDEQNARAVLAA